MADTRFTIKYDLDAMECKRQTITRANENLEQTRREIITAEALLNGMDFPQLPVLKSSLDVTRETVNSLLQANQDLFLALGKIHDDASVIAGTLARRQQEIASLFNQVWKTAT